jgi:hypothetical protein
MEQTCLSDMQPFYEGTLIRQLNIDVHHALKVKSIRDTVMFLLCLVAMCLANFMYFCVSELGSEIEESLPVTMVTNNKQRGVSRRTV